MAEKDFILENSEGAGEIKIANDVIVSIAAQALSEIKGIALGTVADSFVEKLVKKAATGGVKIYADDETKSVDMDVHVSIQYGINIPEISWKIQEAVKQNVEMMTDISVRQVNVFVDGVIIEKEPKPEKVKKQKPAKKAEEAPAEEAPQEA
ncbi:MAG: Asp23/Gls24 family envelope stress response protein [Clostridia bacterium]|nr:Asp23/Gls24 family envelope stress response protein [Clostridia bacterium]